MLVRMEPWMVVRLGTGAAVLESLVSCLWLYCIWGTLLSFSRTCFIVYTHNDDYVCKYFMPAGSVVRGLIVVQGSLVKSSCTFTHFSCG